MVVRFQRLFTVIDGVSLEPVTILIECFRDSSGIYRFAVKSLRGEYSKPQEFEENLDHAINSAERGGKMVWSFLALTLPGFRQLTEEMKGALNASKEAKG